MAIAVVHFVAFTANVFMTSSPLLLAFVLDRLAFGFSLSTGLYWGVRKVAGIGYMCKGGGGYRDDETGKPGDRFCNGKP
jgi:hypothetical protein